MVELSLHLVEALHEILLMDWMRCTLLNHVFHNCSKPEALVMVGLYLLLKLFGAGDLDVLTKHLELLIALQDLILEFSNLFFQRHHEERLLLVLLGSLC